MSSAYASRLDDSDLDAAFADGQFSVFFQPAFDLKTGAPLFAESLVRWRHPMMGLLPPGAFLDAVDRQGRMRELTRLVLERALETRTGSTLASIGVSVNVAASDLLDPGFPEQLSIILRKAGARPSDLMLEVAPPLRGEERFFECLDALAESGVGLILEAHGLTADELRKYNARPFRFVKMGGPVILRFARTIQSITASNLFEMLTVAHDMGARAVALGIEDAETLRALQEWGFDVAQGALLGRPTSLDAVDLSSASRLFENGADTMNAAAAAPQSEHVSQPETAADDGETRAEGRREYALFEAEEANVAALSEAGADLASLTPDLRAGPARLLQFTLADAFARGELFEAPPAQGHMASVKIMKLPVRSPDLNADPRPESRPDTNEGDNVDADAALSIPEPPKRARLRTRNRRLFPRIYGFWPRSWKRRFAARSG